MSAGAEGKLICSGKPVSSATINLYSDHSGKEVAILLLLLLRIIIFIYIK